MALTEPSPVRPDTTSSWSHRIQCIAKITLVSADAEALAKFYCSLGFTFVGGERCTAAPAHSPARWPPAGARVILLALGEETLELITLAQPGRGYPHDRHANDPWFQHFAIVVASMEEAYGWLLRSGPAGWTPITHPAPQQLPEATGGVSAFKFRDPEGHPLELLEFPPQRIPARWRARCAPPRPPATPFRGIDHSAIVVANSQRSAEFYRARFGFTRIGGSVNHGSEQAALDALPHPQVEVTALAPASSRPPHLELLCYRSPPPQKADPRAFAPNDTVATRLVLERSGPEKECNEAALMLRDPDGHRIVVIPGASGKTGDT